MRLTTYTDYSLRLLIFLAVQGERLSTISEVAESYGISRHHLVKVAHQLSVKGYIAASRGKNGGLRLARPADQIAVGAVVRDMEADLAFVPCMHGSEAACRIAPNCGLRTVMERGRAAFLAELDRVRLADIVAERQPLRELLQISMA